MGKHRKKRHAARRIRPNEPTVGAPFRPTEFVEVTSPLSHLTEAETKEILRALGDSANREFADQMAELGSALSHGNPIQLISLFGLLSLLAQQKTEKELTPHTLLAGQYELLHALLLRTPIQQYAGELLDAQRVQEILNCAAGASRAFSLRRIGKFGEELSEPELERLYVVEHIRGETQNVRNWGYPEQMIRIIRGIFEPLDSDFVALTGLSATGLLEMMMGAMHLIEDRVGEHLRRLHHALKGKTITALARRYYEAFPELEESSDQLLQWLRENKVSRGYARSLLLSHSSLRLPSIFTLTLADFVAAYPGDVSADQVRNLLGTWSLSFGDLQSTDPERFFLGNPIWERPLIRLGADQYLLPNAVLFFSFCFEMMESLIDNNPTVKERYQCRRAEYLEDRVNTLLSSAFPDGAILRGSLWNDERTGAQYENDVLVILDDVALVVEAKSGQVTAPARRGAERRLERDIKKLVAEPAEQAARFIDYLERTRAQHTRLDLRTRSGEVNQIDLAGVTRFIPLSVLLENLGPLATHAPTLRAAGLVAENVPLASTIALSDLEVIFETLTRACEKLHYLKRRAEFENHVQYHGDEMDLLGFYVETGFNIGEAEFSREMSLELVGMSAQRIDPYFMRGGVHSSVPKPGPRYTKWWTDLIDRVENRRGRRWTLLGLKLLNVAQAEQVKFEMAFEKVRKTVQTRWNKPGHNNHVIFQNGPPQRRDVFVAAAYKFQPRSERDEFLRVAVGNAIETTGCDEVVVIGVDVDSPIYPYNLMGVFTRPRSDSEGEEQYQGSGSP